jgi:hypothetical protein
MPMRVGTKIGNDYKVEKTLEGYDEDAKLTVDYLLRLETCNGRIGATGTFSCKRLGKVLIGRDVSWWSPCLSSCA